jgi:hypothetical protein
MGVGEGRYVELYWPEPEMKDPILNNSAEFTVSSRLELLSLLMGGPGGWRMHEETLRDMLKAPLTLFLPSQFDAILHMKPGRRCVNLYVMSCEPDAALDDPCTRR